MELGNQIARLALSKRILVLGPSGSGKTTFSTRLGRILDIETIHLDACFWKSGWIATPQSEWRANVAALIRKESWIMDGLYESTLDLRIPAADSMIVVERARLVCLWRVLKRKATIDDRNRPDAPPGQKVDRDFLRYVWRYPAVSRPFLFDCIRRYGRDKALIQLGGSNDIRRLLQQVHRAVERRAQTP
jgi:adenylate kinase family enzyme